MNVISSNDRQHKFVQLMAVGEYLYALDSIGNVWRYSFEERQWVWCVNERKQ